MGTVRRFELHPPGAPRRAAVEALIRRVYRTRYDADLRDFAPVLVSLADETGLVAAAGYRPAQHHPLFLERYLGRPVQTLLPVGDEAPPLRRHIVEVGHLAALRPGEGRRLIAPLTAHLLEEGYVWVVSTATRELRQLLGRMGITPCALGAADPRALGAEQAQWGRYYEHDPVILAGRLAQAMRRLSMARRPQPVAEPHTLIDPCATRQGAES